MKKYLATLATLATSVAFFTLLSTPLMAMTVDEIINTYHQNMGGTKAWSKLKGIKMTGELNQGPMKIPFEAVNLKGGKQYFQFSIQGKTIKQGVFDGNTMWNTNFMSMKAEKADAESTQNQKLNNNDFPDALFNYKKKGYKATLMGEETIDGTKTYKVKLVKEPITIDGKQVDDVTYYYFDEDALVPIVTESQIHSGPAKGKIGQSKLGDYQEVKGLYFPFSITQGIKDGRDATMMIKKIELNPEVPASAFTMPVEAPKPMPAKKEKTDKN